MPAMKTDLQGAVLAAMPQTETGPHPVEKFVVCDTRIARVVLTGRQTPKVKQTVDFGFVDVAAPARAN